MSLSITGELFKVFPTEKKTETFSAREFVLLVPGNYPQHVKFQLVQDKCSVIDNYTEGQEITVHFDLRGREWEGKYFTNLNAWRIEAAGPAEAQPSPEPEEEPEFVADTPADHGKEADDDLPF